MPQETSAAKRSRLQGMHGKFFVARWISKPHPITKKNQDEKTKPLWYLFIDLKKKLR